VTGDAALRADIVEVGRRMYARGYTASNDGNISVRLDAGRLLMTPKSVCKGFMTPDMMCVVDLDGRKLDGERDPSSELKMHLEVYRNRPDVRAVVHAHPPLATGFAVAGIPLDRAVLAVLGGSLAAGLIGAVLVVTGSRPADSLHFVYGPAALIALPVAIWVGARGARAGTSRVRRDAWTAGGGVVLLGIVLRLFATG
jgi:ribulose-5-phosphate 4-epimerase/fuculose-1-phosphate aldolase